MTLQEKIDSLLSMPDEQIQLLHPPYSVEWKGDFYRISVIRVYLYKEFIVEAENVFTGSLCKFDLADESGSLLREKPSHFTEFQWFVADHMLKEMRISAAKSVADRLSDEEL